MSLRSDPEAANADWWPHYSGFCVAGGPCGVESCPMGWLSPLLCGTLGRAGSFPGCSFLMWGWQDLTEPEVKRGCCGSYSAPPGSPGGKPPWALPHLRKEPRPLEASSEIGSHPKRPLSHHTASGKRCWPVLQEHPALSHWPKVYLLCVGPALLPDWGWEDLG